LIPHIDCFPFSLLAGVAAGGKTLADKPEFGYTLLSCVMLGSPEEGCLRNTNKLAVGEG
jgi:hypothetical protein